MGDSGEAGGFRVVDLNYVSLYLEDLDGGVEFYGELFGPPVYEEGRLRGWRMGATWLTLFPSDAGTCAGENPRNTEYAIQVERPGQVDVLYRRLLDLGSVVCREPEDTWMYEPMRFACVDDPFGVRIDIYCPIEEEK
ncbi:MAG: VOC family protein [Anaerolineales bacterium]